MAGARRMTGPIGVVICGCLLIPTSAIAGDIEGGRSIIVRISKKGQSSSVPAKPGATEQIAEPSGGEVCG